MSESMTVESAMEFASVTRTFLCGDKPDRQWQDALLVLAGEVEALQKRVAVRGELCRALEASKQHVEQERDELRRRVADLEPKHECACGMCKMHKDVAKIKAEAVREFADQTGDHYVINMAIDYNKANQIEGGA